jgi:hypothetical protein
VIGGGRFGQELVQCSPNLAPYECCTERVGCTTALGDASHTSDGESPNFWHDNGG